jgi:hypothetical protein
MILQPRDREFLKELSVLRVIDREQAKIVAGFGSTTRANGRLLKLTRAGLLRRFFLGSGGGRKALYSLSEKGAQCAGVPMRGILRPHGAVLVADFFVEHQLAVNAVYCAVKFGLIPIHGVIFHRWVPFREPVAPEIPLIPDGYVEFVTPRGIVTAFLEIDLGNEALKVWRGKTEKYLQLAMSGAYRRVFGHDRFRVLVIANSPRRLESLRTTVSATTEKIFRFTSCEEARTGFFLPIWRKPQGDHPELFIEQTL